MNALNAIYAGKPDTYFAGARGDIVQQMATTRRSTVLELGCGNGATGLATLAAGKAGRYIGIELDPKAARLARNGLSEVLVGDVADLDLTRLHGSCDALIASEVFEHLVDPWAVLEKLVACLKPGAAVYASTPNASHWKIIASLARGRFDYTAEGGVMDRTHLRWYTRATIWEMFEAAGISVRSVEPSAPLRSKAALFNRLTGGKLRHLLHTQMTLRGVKR